MIELEPIVLVEVISVTPAMRPSWRSSGVATAVAIVSGAAPGSEAVTLIVGKSTCGSGATGSRRNAAAPASANPNVNNVVATGRLMNGAERFTAVPARALRRDQSVDVRSRGAPADRTRDRSRGSCTA